MSTLKLPVVAFHVLLALVVNSLFPTLSWSQNTETPPLILNGDFSTWVPVRQNDQSMLPAHWQSQVTDQRFVIFAAPPQAPSLTLTTRGQEAKLIQQLRRLPRRRFTISGKYKKAAISVSADITLQFFYKAPQLEMSEREIFSSPLNIDNPN